MFYKNKELINFKKGQLIKNVKNEVSGALVDQLVPLADFILDTMIKLLLNQKNDFLNSIDHTKLKLDELKILCAKIKQNPIRLLDLLIYLSESNDRILSQALDVTNFKEYDQWVNFVIDLILNRIDFWDDVTRSRTTTSSIHLDSTASSFTTLKPSVANGNLNILRINIKIKDYNIYFLTIRNFYRRSNLLQNKNYR